MAGEYLTFDAASSAIDGSSPGTAVNVGPGTDLRLREFSPPAPPQTVQYAGSVDTEGSLPASRKHENRQITLKIMCDTAAALRSLQDKVGKVAREGGTLTWVLPNAETVIFDLHAADTFNPEFRTTFYRDLGKYCDVEIVLSAMPYGRGPSVTLSASAAATTGAPLVFTKTGIKGDMSGLGKLRISNASNAKTFAVWGVESRYYSAASSAALFFEAESGAVLDAALNAGPAGASGAGGNKTMLHSNPGTLGGNSYQVASAGLTHVGSFRVYTRVYVSGSGTISLRAAWKATLPGATIANDYVPIVDSGGGPIGGAWVIVDLGLVSIQKPQFGSSLWDLTLTAQSSDATTDVYYDWVALVPVSEGYGVVREPDAVLPINAAYHVDITDRGAFVTDGTVYWKPTLYEGVYLRVPPAGGEARTLRVFAMLAGDPAIGNTTESVVDAANLNAITGTLTYTPRYLVVPSP